MDNFSEAHERYLAAHRISYVDVWCSNSACDNSRAPRNVVLESEYGQAWYIPEECPACHSAWTDKGTEER